MTPPNHQSVGWPHRSFAYVPALHGKARGTERGAT